MKLTHVKESVKNKLHKGNKNNRTHYKIYMTEQHKTIIGNRKFKIAIRDNNNGIDKDTADLIRTQWIYKGGAIKDFNRLGVVKCLQILKGI